MRPLISHQHEATIVFVLQVSQNLTHMSLQDSNAGHGLPTCADVFTEPVIVVENDTLLCVGNNSSYIS